MGKSQETFGKKEQQKKKMQKRNEKAEKMQERKANAKKGKSLDDMLAYLDENGNLSSVPPDPSKRREFKQEDIQIGVPQHSDEEMDPIRNGVVKFFNDTKGFGFIRDLQTQESIFVHVKNLSEPLYENDKVVFEIEHGPKGLTAVNVKKSR